MIATQLTKHAVNFLDWNFMDYTGIQFIPDGMEQERPELPVALGIWALHADNDDRQRDRDRRRICRRRNPWITSWHRWFYQGRQAIHSVHYSPGTVRKSTFTSHLS